MFQYLVNVGRVFWLKLLRWNPNSTRNPALLNVAMLSQGSSCQDSKFLSYCQRSMLVAIQLRALRFSPRISPVDPIIPNRLLHRDDSLKTTWSLLLWKDWCGCVVSWLYQDWIQPQHLYCKALCFVYWNKIDADLQHVGIWKCTKRCAANILGTYYKVM